MSFYLYLESHISIFVVRQIDLEEAKVVWLPVVRRHEAKACWIDKRHDRQWHAAVWKIDTADAAVILELHAQEVFVCAMFAVTSWLHASHHELIFRRYLLLNSLLLMEVLDLVLDLVQGNFHLSRPLSCLRIRSFHLLFDELGCDGVGMVVMVDSHFLLNEKTDLSHLQLAFTVIDVNRGVSNFMRGKDVLVESAPHR